MRTKDAEHVLTQNAADLLAYFRRRVTNAEDAADLVNDTVIAALRAAKRMPKGEEPARMWMFGIARNTLRHHHRAQSRRDALTARLAATSDPNPWTDDHTGIDVRAAVEKLPDELAELVRLVHWDGFSLEQAAILMRVPASTARTRHVRAKKLLRAALSPHSQQSPAAARAR